MKPPSVGIVLPVRNGASILGGTLQSLMEQTWTDFRVIVVDGASTDATLDLLGAAGQRLTLDVVSEPDGGVADALAKGLARSSEDIVGIIAADERYEPAAITTAIAAFQSHPDAVAMVGRSQFIEAGPDGTEEVVDSYLTAPFGLYGHLSCEVAWPIAASFFNRTRLGTELRYDGSVETCPDYELWGRLGFTFDPSAFVRVETPMSRAFRSAVSMSFRPEAYPQMVADKLEHLGRLIDRFLPGDQRAQAYSHAASGIHMWAAEQLLALRAPRETVVDQCRMADQLGGARQRLDAFLKHSRLVKRDPTTGHLGNLCPSAPSPNAVVLSLAVQASCQDDWEGASILAEDPLTVRTADAAWGYSMYLIPERSEGDGLAGFGPAELWLSVEIEVTWGAVGVGVFLDGGIAGEVVVRAGDGPTTLYLSGDDGASLAGILRSAGRGGSIARIDRLAVLADPRP